MERKERTTALRVVVFFKTSTDAQSKSVVGGQKDREGWHENYSGQECPTSREDLH